MTKGICHFDNRLHLPNTFHEFCLLTENYKAATNNFATFQIVYRPIIRDG